MTRVWTVSDQDGQHSRRLTLSQYLEAIEQAQTHGLKLRLYCLESARPRDTPRR